MTLASTNTAYEVPNTGTGQALLLWPVLVATLLGVLVISLPNLVDPMVRHDDYPALFADAAGFWDKTLHEGRWVNYIWHLRGVVTPAWLNFAVYQTVCAIFAAAIAVAALGRAGSGWFTYVLAVLILVGPPASLISLWFNTMMPGLAVVALYAVLACRLSLRVHRMLLPLFVVVSFMSYTMFPPLLLAVCLARSEQRSIRDLTGLVALFVVSFAAAVLLTYTLNWQIHGVFGVPMAEWRTANPATDLASLMENVPLVIKSLGDFLIRSSFEFFPAMIFHLAMLTGATLVLLRLAPKEALYLHAGMWIGFSLVVVQVLKIGVVVPPRAFIFAWVFYAIIVVRAAELLSRNPGIAGRMMRNLVLLIVCSYLLQTFQQYTVYRAWQAETRAIAKAVASANGAVIVKGDVMQLNSARRAFVQTEKALNYRMQQLIGRELVLCSVDPEACRGLEDAQQLFRSGELNSLTIYQDNGRMQPIQP